MGQRFQTVFILPPIFMNENNPNNRGKKIIAFHNQWCFGRGAIYRNFKILNRLKNAIYFKNRCGFGDKITKKEFINHHLEKSINQAVSFVNSEDYHYSAGFNNYHDDDKSYKDKDGNYKSVGYVLACQDNNNGYFIIEITDDLKLEYTFISGLEDTETHRLVTPQEYLDLFYTKEQLESEQKGLSDSMQKLIAKYNKFKQMDTEKVNKIIQDIHR